MGRPIKSLNDMGLSVTQTPLMAIARAAADKKAAAATDVDMAKSG